MSKKMGRPPLKRGMFKDWCVGKQEAAEFLGHKSYSTVSLWVNNAMFTLDEYIPAGPKTKELCGQWVDMFYKPALLMLKDNARKRREECSMGLISEDRQYNAMQQGVNITNWRPRRKQDPELRRRMRRQRIHGYTREEIAALYGEEVKPEPPKPTREEMDKILGIPPPLEEAVLEWGGDPDKEYPWVRTIIPEEFISRMEKICKDRGLALELINEGFIRAHGEFVPETIEFLVQYKAKKYFRYIAKYNRELKDNNSEETGS